MKSIEQGPIILQAVGKKEPFNRSLGTISQGGQSEAVMGQRQVKIAYGLNETTGLCEAIAEHLVPTETSAVPNLTYHQTEIIYRSEDFGKRPDQVMKNGASTKITTLEVKGDPTHKLTKPARSFSFPLYGAEVERKTTNHTVVQEKIEEPDCMKDIPF